MALNTHGTPTAAFVKQRRLAVPGRPLRGGRARQRRRRDCVGAFDAEQVAVQLLGDSIYTNPLMLGYAWQQGRMPLSHAALMRAIELNGVQVDNNKAAFEWGRRCAHDLAAVQALFKAAQVIEFVKKPSLDEMVAKRVEFLTGYQDAAYAAQYKAFVDKVRAAEAPLGQSKAERSGGALPVQADGLQGRVRGRAPAHRPGLPGQDRSRCSRATTSWCTTWRRR